MIEDQGDHSFSKNTSCKDDVFEGHSTFELIIGMVPIEMKSKIP